MKEQRQKRNINIPLRRVFCYNMNMKKVKIKPPYITLGQFLKLEDIISNGGDVKAFLLEVDVFVNGELEDRRGRKLYEGYVIEILNQKYVLEY